MTVSRVINREDSVRKSTREAVNQAIRDLGYSPNKAARSLASASHVQIGLIYDNPSSAFLSAMLLGVLEQARQSDTQIVVVECESDDDAISTIRGLVKGGIDGILLAPPLADTPAVLDVLKQNDTLAVTIGSKHANRGISSVTIDEYRASHAMTQHVISLGHRRVGFIVGSPKHMASSMRLAGFRDAMREAGLEVEEDLVVQGRFSYRSGLEAAERLIGLDPRPTAIFASNDDMAAATVATAHRHHIEIPEDLTVCGFDDTLLATTIWPEITTIHQPITDMSHAAIELLEKSVRQRRSGLDVETEHLTLEFSLVKRQSDAPPSGAVRS